jgi:hypothetical protein
MIKESMALDEMCLQDNTDHAIWASRPNELAAALNRIAG